MLIDDPHNLAEAESDAERESVVQNFRENVLNRVNDPAHSAIVLIMQRVHEKDVSGEILRGDFGFEHLCLPMRFESSRRCHTRTGFRDPRSWEGEILFPQLANVTAVDRLEAAMGSYAFAAQYQQAPVSREGNWFKRAFFPPVDGPPPKILRRVMAWDLASTEKMGSNDPDWTVGLLGGVDEAGDIWILELFRFRKSPGARNTFIEEIVRSYGYEVLQLFPLDPGQAGKDQEHNLKKLLERHGQLKFTPPHGDKKKRVMDSGALVNAELGRIRLTASTERSAFLDEVCAFPAGRHERAAVRDLSQLMSGGAVSPTATCLRRAHEQEEALPALSGGGLGRSTSPRPQARDRNTGADGAAGRTQPALEPGLRGRRPLLGPALSRPVRRRRLHSRGLGGPVVDRTLEHLTPGDAMIVRTRHRLLNALRALEADGVAPPGVDDPEVALKARSGAYLAPAETDWLEAYRSGHERRSARKAACGYEARHGPCRADGRPGRCLARPGDHPAAGRNARRHRLRLAPPERKALHEDILPAPPGGAARR